MFRLLYSIIFFAAAAEVVLSQTDERHAAEKERKRTLPNLLVSESAGGWSFLFSSFLPFFNPSWDSTAPVLRCLLQWPLPVTPTPVQHAKALQRKQVSAAV